MMSEKRNTVDDDGAKLKHLMELSCDADKGIRFEISAPHQLQSIFAGDVSAPVCH